MDFLIAFGPTGKPSHAQPPGWFMLLGFAAGFAYWLFLKIRYSKRTKRERGESGQEPPAVVQPDFELQSAAVPLRRQDKEGSASDPRREHAVARASFEHWLAYIIILAALAGWTITEPPPERCLPVVVLALATAAIAVETVVLWRQQNPKL